MTKKWIVSGITIIGITAIILLLGIMPARAQDATPESDANCVACHEHQYYLYDSGKWFCLCEAPMHCVYCHGGRTDSTVAEIAHEGLVLYPTHNEAERCQTCHNADYLSRVVTFETVAGVSSSPIPVITATPFESEPIPKNKRPAILLRMDQLGLWQLIGLGILIIAGFVLLLFAYRCWKADCMTKLKS